MSGVDSITDYNVFYSILLRRVAQSLGPSYTTRFSMKSVNSNMQTGSDFWQIASTSPDSKSAENQDKNCVIPFDVVIKTFCI